MLMQENNPVMVSDINGLIALAWKRRFANGGSIMYAFPARHCYVAFGDGTTLSWDNRPDAPHPDSASNTKFESCDVVDPSPSCLKEKECGKRKKECCTDECIKAAMRMCRRKPYDFIDWNCCDCVRDALSRCGCSIPEGIKNANFGK